MKKIIGKIKENININNNNQYQKINSNLISFKLSKKYKTILKN